MFTPPVQLLRLYRDFKAIDPRDPYGIIRYYERYEMQLSALEWKEHLECMLAYTQALLDTDDFARHVVMCDFLIEWVMRENIREINGEDPFLKLLLDKGRALYRSDQLPAAVSVLSELERIHPGYSKTRPLLLQSLLQQRTPRKQLFRALSLLFFLLSALSAGTSGLVVQPFYAEGQVYVTNITIALFATGATLYLYGEFQHWRWCKAQMTQLQQPKRA